MSGERAAGTSAPQDPTSRERWVVDTLVQLANTLVSDFDLFDLLSLLSARCVEFLQASEAGLLVAGEDARLHVVASSSEQMHSLELFELQSAEGPCFDVYTRREPVLNEPLADTRWPLFAPKARAAGFQTVHALPMRHNHEVIGVLNILDHRAPVLSGYDAAVTQALADIATFALLQHRALRHATALAEQLQGALQTRIAVEQAKGMLSARLQGDVGTAFDLLRRYSRNRNERIGDVARRVVEHRLSTAEIVAGADGRGTAQTTASHGDTK